MNFTYEPDLLKIMCIADHPLIVKPLLILPYTVTSSSIKTGWIPILKSYKMSNDYFLQDSANFWNGTHQLVLNEKGRITIKDQVDLSDLYKFIQNIFIPFDENSNLLKIYFDYVGSLAIEDLHLSSYNSKMENIFPVISKKGPIHSSVEISVDPRLYIMRGGKLHTTFSHMLAIMESFLSKNQFHIKKEIMDCMDTVWEDF